MLRAVPSSAAAQELRIRAVLANPVAAEETEWIALENPGIESVSTQGYNVRDVFGSTKQYALSGVLAAGEVWLLPRTQTGITLNNDREMVELLKGDLIVHQSQEQVNPGNDQVWVDLSSGWEYIPLAEWLDRLEQKNWRKVASPSPVPSSPPSVSPVPSPAPGSGPIAQLELLRFSPCTMPEWVEIRARTAGRADEIRFEDSTGLLVKAEDREFVAGETLRLEWTGAKLNNSGEWVKTIFPLQQETLSYGACVGTEPYSFFQGKWQQGAGDQGGQALGVATEQESAPLNGEDTLQSKEAPLELEVQNEKNFSAVALQATRSAGVLENRKFFPQAPLPDFEQEERDFLRWKERSLLGSLGLAFSGSLSLVLSVPSLWSWYNEHKDPW